MAKNAQPQKTKVTMYTDGSSLGNPGPGGYGVVLLYTDPYGKTYRKELSGGEPKTTNNRMELMGVIAGLRALTRPCSIQIFSDSKYFVDAFVQHWLPSWIKMSWVTSSGTDVKNVDLWKEILSLIDNGHDISCQWVKGHNNNPENERCDQLAKAAASKYQK